MTYSVPKSPSENFFKASSNPDTGVWRCPWRILLKVGVHESRQRNSLPVWKRSRGTACAVAASKPIPIEWPKLAQAKLNKQSPNSQCVLFVCRGTALPEEVRVTMPQRNAALGAPNLASRSFRSLLKKRGEGGADELFSSTGEVSTSAPVQSRLEVWAESLQRVAFYAVRFPHFRIVSSMFHDPLPAHRCMRP